MTNRVGKRKVWKTMEWVGRKNIKSLLVGGNLKQLAIYCSIFYQLIMQSWNLKKPHPDSEKIFKLS